MRAVIAGCALLLFGNAAAQARSPYDDGFDGPPPPPHHHHRPCRIVWSDFGPHRVCPDDF